MAETSKIEPCCVCVTQDQCRNRGECIQKDAWKREEFVSTKVADVLRKALALFGPNGNYWHRGGCRAVGRECFCVQTALSMAIESDRCSRSPAVVEAIKQLGFSSVKQAWDWNDDPKRTFAEVKAKYEEAIAKAEADTGAAK